MIDKSGVKNRFIYSIYIYYIKCMFTKQHTNFVVCDLPSSLFIHSPIIHPCLTNQTIHLKKSFKNTHHPTVSVWGSASIKVKVWTSWHVYWKLQGLQWNSMVLILFKVYLLWPGSKTVVYGVFSPGFWDRWWKWHRNLVKYTWVYCAGLRNGWFRNHVQYIHIFLFASNIRYMKDSR